MNLCQLNKEPTHILTPQVESLYEFYGSSSGRFMAAGSATHGNLLQAMQHNLAVEQVTSGQ